MSVLTLNVDEVMRTLSAESSNPFVVHDKEVDIVRFAINSGFADIVLDGQVALRVMYQRPRETEVRAQTLTYYDTDGLHNYYDWQLSQSDLAKNGSLMVALCILDISGGEVSEWHTTPCAVRVLSTIHTDDSDEGDDTITPTVKERVAVLETMIQRVASGAPIVVSSASAMTDTNQIYVLSTNGRWYYHNGSAWVAGGEYGGVADGSVTTDKLADGAVTTAKIADGAVTKAKLSTDLKEDISGSALTTNTIGSSVFYSTVRVSVPSSQIEAGWALDGTGLCVRTEYARIVKLNVTPGTSIWIKCPKNYDGVYQFQSSEEVPMSGVNNNLVGSPVTTATDTLVGVPDDATWVILTYQSSDTESGVYEYARKTDIIENKADTEFNIINPALFNRTKRITIPARQIADGYALTASGNSVKNADARLAKWEVNSGDAIWIKCPKNYDGVYQFQSESTVPSTGLNNALIGAPVASETDGIVVVPNGATWVVLTYPKSGDSTSGVYDYEAVTDSIINYSNLIGLRGKLLYPVYIKANTAITIATADRTALEQSGLTLLLFDSRRTQVEYYGFPPASKSRTVTPTHDIYYAAWDKAPSKDVQLNVGNQVLDYVPYALNPTNATVIEATLTAVSETNAIDLTFNSAYHVGAKDFSVKCTEFSALMYGDTMNDVNAPTDFESFLFFTDPHLLQNTGWESQCYELITQIQKYYNSTPTTFCLCGGDWLGDADTPGEACYKLGYINGFMHSKFDNCHLLVGNHDTNYQGKKDEESDNFTTRLSEQSIIDLWYRRDKKSYGFFDGANTRFYYFDTGTERQALISYNNYGMRQAEFFANSLLSDNSPHIAVTMHILHNTVSDKDMHPLSEQILEIAEAYNNRSAIALNGTTYDYTNASGRIEFGIFGHSHADYDVIVHGIPCVVTTWVRASATVATFDLVFVNYDVRQINLIRVGVGDNRVISLD